MKALENFGSFHCYDDAGAVIDRSGAEIPRVEMSRDDDGLLGMFGAFEVGDDVIAGFVRQLLRSDDQTHADGAFGREVGDQVGVFGGNCGRGNSGGSVEAGVREAIVGAVNGAVQLRDCTEIGGSFGPSGTVADSLAIGGEGVSSSGFLFVERFVEENYFAGNLVAAEGVEFVESVYRDDVCSETICGS